MDGLADSGSRAGIGKIGIYPMADFSNESVIKEFRENGGKVGGYFEGLPLLLLTTTGAKSGKTYVSPMIYLDEGGRLHVFASKAGAPTSPGWYHNLVANPEVTVEVGGESFQARAAVLPDPARGDIYSKQSALLPQFADYEKKTTRKIPVVALDRAG